MFSEAQQEHGATVASLGREAESRLAEQWAELQSERHNALRTVSASYVAEVEPEIPPLRGSPTCSQTPPPVSPRRPPPLLRATNAPPTSPLLVEDDASVSIGRSPPGPPPSSPPSALPASPLLARPPELLPPLEGEEQGCQCAPLVEQPFLEEAAAPRLEQISPADDVAVVKMLTAAKVGAAEAEYLVAECAAAAVAVAERAEEEMAADAERVQLGVDMLVTAEDVVATVATERISSENVELAPGSGDEYVLVVCPESVDAGQLILVSTADGRDVQTEVPEGVKPGDEFEVFIGVVRSGVEPLSPTGDDSDYMLVSCPEGVVPGQLILVTAPDGRDVEAMVPEGICPGDEFEVYVGGAVDTEDVVSEKAVALEVEEAAPQEVTAEAAQSTSAAEAASAAATAAAGEEAELLAAAAEIEAGRVAEAAEVEILSPEAEAAELRRAEDEAANEEAGLEGAAVGDEGRAEVEDVSAEEKPAAQDAQDAELLAADKDVEPDRLAERAAFEAERAHMAAGKAVQSMAADDAAVAAVAVAAAAAAAASEAEQKRLAEAEQRAAEHAALARRARVTARLMAAKQVRLAAAVEELQRTRAAFRVAEKSRDAEVIRRHRALVREVHFHKSRLDPDEHATWRAARVQAVRERLESDPASADQRRQARLLRRAVLMAGAAARLATADR